MTLSSERVIDDLIERTQLHINQVERFNYSTLEELNSKVSLETWSVLERLEHLNLYGAFRKRISNLKSTLQRY